MNIDALIQGLANATGPHRRLDEAIGRAIGFNPVVEGEAGANQRVVWLDPAKRAADRLPQFTRSFEEARELISMTSPGKSVAISCDKIRQFRAVIEGGEPCVAETGPLAMCMAALKDFAKTNEIVAE